MAANSGHIRIKSQTRSMQYMHDRKADNYRQDNSILQETGRSGVYVMSNEKIREQLRKKGIYVFSTIEQWGAKTDNNIYVPAFGYDVYNYNIETSCKLELRRYISKTLEYKDIENIMYQECKEAYLKE